MCCMWGEGGWAVVTSVSGDPGWTGSASSLSRHVLCTSIILQTGAGVEAGLQASWAHMNWGVRSWPHGRESIRLCVVQWAKSPSQAFLGLPATGCMREGGGHRKGPSTRGGGPSPCGVALCLPAWPLSTYCQLEGSSESPVTQSCLTLCNPMDCSLPGSSVHGSFQARILEWVAISFSKGNTPKINFIPCYCFWGTPPHPRPQLLWGGCHSCGHLPYFSASWAGWRCIKFPWRVYWG